MTRYSKFITAIVAAIGVIAANLLTPSDAETVSNILTAAISLLGALGVYAVPNSPTSRQS